MTRSERDFNALIVFERICHCAFVVKEARAEVMLSSSSALIWYAAELKKVRSLRGAASMSSQQTFCHCSEQQVVHDSMGSYASSFRTDLHALVVDLHEAAT